MPWLPRSSERPAPASACRGASAGRRTDRTPAVMKRLRTNAAPCAASIDLVALGGPPATRRHPFWRGFMLVAPEEVCRVNDHPPINAREMKAMIAYLERVANAGSEGDRDSALGE